MIIDSTSPNRIGPEPAISIGRVLIWFRSLVAAELTLDEIVGKRSRDSHGCRRSVTTK